MQGEVAVEDTYNKRRTNNYSRNVLGRRSLVESQFKSTLNRRGKVIYMPG